MVPMFDEGEIVSGTCEDTAFSNEASGLSFAP